MSRPAPRPFALALLAAVLGAAACDRAPNLPPSPPIADAPGIQDSTHRIVAITGFSGPEAVRYDSVGDAWFVANFNGDPAGDANGFISRVTADGRIDSLRFMTGTTTAPLHGPRGMFIRGDTLWVADANGVHAFHRVTGAQLAFHDFTALDPGFLNDVAVGTDGDIYVTDTGRQRIHRIRAGEITTVVDGDRRLGATNGITPEGSGSARFLLAGWAAGGMVRAWEPGAGTITDIGTATTGRFDGIEVVDGRIVIASQADSSLHLIADGVETRIVRTPGAPADIGVDTRRGRVAVPYIALDRVDLWALPPAP